MSSDQSNHVKPVFYVEEPPLVPDIEDFFSSYASIPATALRPHLIKVRQCAWEKCKYPCLGRWGFLDFSIKKNPIYQEILHNCKTEAATFIDFGCCLGQDIRQLAADGIELRQIRGYDIDPFFIELGYELFCDKIVMKENNVFQVGDIFDDKFLNQAAPADYVYVGSFIHLFDRETQNVVCQRLLRLAKRAIAGRQVGASQFSEQPRLSGLTDKKIVRHSPESFSQMWKEVSDGQWLVEHASLALEGNTEVFGQQLIFVVRKQIDTKL